MGLFSKKKETTIDPEQRELVEKAQARVRQKKNLYRHFVVFIAGAILLIVLNLALGIGGDIKLFGQDWFVWAILLWTFFFLVHLINVLVFGRFMNKQWEKEQVDKLVHKQKNKIAQLQQQIDAQNPLPEKKSPLLTDPEKPFIDQNTPL